VAVAILLLALWVLVSSIVHVIKKDGGGATSMSTIHLNGEEVAERIKTQATENYGLSEETVSCPPGEYVEGSVLTCTLNGPNGTTEAEVDLRSNGSGGLTAAVNVK
jgi:hypothetical protein